MDIDITGLAKTYRGGVQALTDVDLHIPTGMYGLLGANGAGKTTLMRILAGVLPASGGEVLAGDHDLSTKAGRAAVQRSLGYLPQELGLYPDLSAAEFLDYVGMLKGIGGCGQRRRQIGELLDLVALSGVADRKIKTYSGGMKRRLGIAQALLGNPELVIVDEPTAGLDPEERMRFRTLLAGLATDRTVLLSTHIVGDIAQACPQLAVLAAGRLVYHGTVTGLADRAARLTYTVTTTVPPPDGAIVSAQHTPTGTTYRIVTNTPPADAVQVQAGLEDGYLALMHTTRAAATTGTVP
jgi:ABC-type multidrug transport system ATPase subunit